MKWLPIQQRFEFKVAVLAFDCVRGTCPSYFCGICTPLIEVGGRVRLPSAHRVDLCWSVIYEDRIWQTQFPSCCTQNMELLTATSPFANHQPTTFQSGLKTHLFKRAYIWLLPPRTIEEWTYLLTYLLSEEKHHFGGWGSLTKRKSSKTWREYVDKNVNPLRLELSDAMDYRKWREIIRGNCSNSNSDCDAVSWQQTVCTFLMPAHSG